MQFISTSTTSRAWWTTLEKTYGSPLRGRIMIHRQNLVSPQQGIQTITAYIQDAKHNIDSLALMRSYFLMFGSPPLLLLMVFTTTLFLLTIIQSINGFTRYFVNQMFIQPMSPSRILLKTISPPPLKPFT